MSFRQDREHIIIHPPHQQAASPIGEFHPKMLSVIIITKNESANIRRCLESVRWAEEIVVVDSGSEDDTAEICRQYTDKVSFSAWSGFGRQKNKALDLAEGEWILSIDADEQISDDLRTEIQKITNDPGSADAWLIPRKSSYCGRFMNHSGWSPDYVLRLFRRGKGRFSDDLVHERIQLADGVATPQKTRGKMLHFPMPTFEQAIEKMNLYSTLSAQDKFDRGERGSLIKAISRSVWTFIRVYFLRRGFLDGRHGFMLAVSNAGGAYYKYVKLAHLHERAATADQDRP